EILNDAKTRMAFHEIYLALFKARKSVPDAFKDTQYTLWRSHVLTMKVLRCLTGIVILASPSPG
ncbi:MAG: hypothetical protein ABTQ26_01610, partial [Azonexus sp.]